MGCLNNCNHCIYKAMEKSGWWCYMFREEPEGQCFQMKPKKTNFFNSDLEFLCERDENVS